MTKRETMNEKGVVGSMKKRQRQDIASRNPKERRGGGDRMKG